MLEVGNVRVALLLAMFESEEPLLPKINLPVETSSFCIAEKPES